MSIIDLLYVGFFTIMIYTSVLWLLVYIRNHDRVYHNPDPSRYPSVTFLVPAYNEEEYISDTIEALLAIDYPEEKLDVIAINDGSIDGTLEILQQYADRIEIIDKENTGKANSLNQALERVDTELVASMDADSVPSQDYLQKMVGYLERDGVKGVTPAMKVQDPSNWVEKIQWTEYIFQIFLRKVFAIFDAQYVMPGPGSVYDTAYLKELGGWDEETLTEDMEVAFRIVSSGQRIENSSDAFVDTVAPPDLKALFRQRIRWYRGYIENFLAYRDLLGNTDYGNLGVFLLPFNLVWILLVIFFLTHFTYNILHTVYTAIQTYLLVGFLQPSFSFSILSVHFFHLFMLFFVAMGIGTILISLRVSHEPIKLRERKTHYLTFLTVYPFLFAAFWIAAIWEEVSEVDPTW